jgi:hypothetical protein
MIGQRVDHLERLTRLQEHEPAVAVVVGQRAEGLGSDGDLRVKLECIVKPDEHVLVDPAHPVDRDLLDEELLFQEFWSVGLIGWGGRGLHGRSP